MAEPEELMSSRDPFFVFRQVAAATTLAPTVPGGGAPVTDGAKVNAGADNAGVRSNASEFWVFVKATGAGTGQVADFIPFYLIATDPENDVFEWIAGAKVEGIPLDGAQSTAANGGQIKLLDSLGGVVDRIYLMWTAVGEELEATVFAANQRR